MSYRLLKIELFIVKEKNKYFLTYNWEIIDISLLYFIFTFHDSKLYIHLSSPLRKLFVPEMNKFPPPLKYISILYFYKESLCFLHHSRFYSAQIQISNAKYVKKFFTDKGNCNFYKKFLWIFCKFILATDYTFSLL